MHHPVPLTPGDHPVLRVRETHEDRTRLLHLIQRVGSVGRDGHDRCHCDTTDGDTSQSTEGPDSSTPVRRRLDFSLAAVNVHPEPFDSSSETVRRRRPSCGGRLSEGGLQEIPGRYLSSQSPAGLVSTPELFPSPKSDPNSRPNPRHNRNPNPRHTITGSNQGNKHKVKNGRPRAAKPGHCGKGNPGTKPTAVHCLDGAAGCHDYGVPTRSPPSPKKK